MKRPAQNSDTIVSSSVAGNWALIAVYPAPSKTRPSAKVSEGRATKKYSAAFTRASAANSTDRCALTAGVPNPVFGRHGAQRAVEVVHAAGGQRDRDQGCKQPGEYVLQERQGEEVEAKVVAELGSVTPTVEPLRNNSH